MAKDVFSAVGSSKEVSTIVGFKTDLGSLYEYNAEAQTVKRFKVSARDGEQAGLLLPESMVYFVGKKAKDVLLNEFYYAEHDIFFGFACKNKQIHYYPKNRIDLPEGGKRMLLITGKGSEEILKKASVEASAPEIGLHPLDTAFYNPDAGYNPETNTGTAFAHLGNEIVKIYTDKEEFNADLQAAKARFSPSKNDPSSHKDDPLPH